MGLDQLLQYLSKVINNRHECIHQLTTGAAILSELFEQVRPSLPFSLFSYSFPSCFLLCCIWGTPPNPTRIIMYEHVWESLCFLTTAVIFCVDELGLNYTNIAP